MLMIVQKGKRYGFEMKLSDAPTITKSMRVALADLGLARLFVVYPGARSYALDERIDVLSIRDLATRLGSTAKAPGQKQAQ
jgi:hypothetical protein